MWARSGNARQCCLADACLPALHVGVSWGQKCHTGVTGAKSPHCWLQQSSMRLSLEREALFTLENHSHLPSPLQEKVLTHVIIFFNLFIFYWRIIAFQYCVGFCYISTWISHRYTYISFFLNLPPIPSYPFRLLQSLGLSSLRHTANSHRLSILHMVVHIFPLLFFSCYNFDLFTLIPSHNRYQFH